MENKINVAELLLNCPKGMPLDCSMWDNVTLKSVVIDDTFPIKVAYPTNGDTYTTELTKYGGWSNVEAAKCVIFPKGKTTWEGFVPPCKFKDGDIIFTHTNASKGLLEDSWVSIFKEYRNNRCACYACLCLSDLELYHDKWEDELLCELCEIEENRLATEDEKEKLFKAIKENGYEWYQDTKSLVKLFKPNFKAGDRIRNKTDKYLADRTIASYVEGIGYFTTINDWVRINEQDNWELVITPSFEYGDVIENKNTHTSLKIISVKSDEYIVEDVKGSCFILTFNKQDEWKLVKKEKFDISKLKAFESKVLVRDSIEDVWRPAIFGAVVKKKEKDMSFVVVGGGFFEQCIPYIENEHLLGTTNDCCGYYKIW